MSEPLMMWTVYEHPTDAPDFYVARRFEIWGRTWRATEDVVKSRLLGEVRAAMEARGLTCLPRMAEDEPQIVECWL